MFLEQLAFSCSYRQKWQKYIPKLEPIYFALKVLQKYLLERVERLSDARVSKNDQSLDKLEAVGWLFHCSLKAIFLILIKLKIRLCCYEWHYLESLIARQVPPF